MALFQYRGLDKSGRSVAGTMVAEDPINLEEKLRASGYWLLDAKPKEQSQNGTNGSAQSSWLAWGTGVKRRDLLEFCTMMSFQTRAGVPLVQSLKGVSDDCNNLRFKQVIQGRQRLRQGRLVALAAAGSGPRRLRPGRLPVLQAVQAVVRPAQTESAHLWRVAADGRRLAFRAQPGAVVHVGHAHRSGPETVRG